MGRVFSLTPSPEDSRTPFLNMLSRRAGIRDLMYGKIEMSARSLSNKFIAHLVSERLRYSRRAFCHTGVCTAEMFFEKDTAKSDSFIRIPASHDGVCYMLMS